LFVESILRNLDRIDREVVKALAIRKLLTENENLCARSAEALYSALIIINTSISEFSAEDVLLSLEKLSTAGVVRRFRRSSERDICFKLNENIFEYVHKNLYTSVLL
jgi:hypothetical protein